MRLQLIAEGKTKLERFIRKWGLSFLVDEDILFDCFGDTTFFIEQIKELNIDISRIKDVVISHEHWDHTNGLWYILEKNKNVNIYLCEHFSSSFSQKIEETGAVVHRQTSALQIRENIFLTKEFKTLYKGEILYEQAMVIKTGHGLVCLMGCAHPGVVKMVEEIKDDLDDNVYMIIGGFHMQGNTDDQNMDIVKKLKKIGVQKVVPMHCTGKEATSSFKQIYLEDAICLNNGDRLDL